MKFDAFIYYLILIIIFAAIFGKFIFIPFNEGLWWDEAVYLGLGKNILQGGYSLDPLNAVESFRPPAFPFFISFLSFSLFMVRIFVVFISVLAVLSLYYLTRLLFDKRTALWSSLFISTNFLFVFFTTKALTEALFILFFTLSLVFFIKWGSNKKKSHLILSAVLSGAAFLTRYLGIILIVSYILYFLYLILKENRKNSAKNLVLLLVPFFIVLIPWFLINIFYFHGIISAFTTNFSITTSTAATPLLVSIMDFFMVLHITAIFLVIGLYSVFKKYKKDLYLISLIVLLSVFIFFWLPHREPRYLLTFLPAYSILSGFGLVKILDAIKGRAKNLVSFGVIFVSLVVLVSAFYAINIDNNASKALVQASERIKQITEADEIILSASYPYGYAVAERKTVGFCRTPDTNQGVPGCKQALEKNNWNVQVSLMKEFGIRYVIVYVFEPEAPENAREFFDSSPEFEKIKSFYQWGDPEAAVIYKFKS